LHSEAIVRVKVEAAGRDYRSYAAAFRSACVPGAIFVYSRAYFGKSVTGTSVMLSTGRALSVAALRTAASLGPS
jgi:hypothetical protein